MHDCELLRKVCTHLNVIFKLIAIVIAVIFSELMQRLSKCCDIENSSFTLDKELNISMYVTAFYVIVYIGVIVFKMVQLLAHSAVTTSLEYVQHIPYFWKERK